MQTTQITVQEIGFSRVILKFCLFMKGFITKLYDLESSKSDNIFRMARS